MTRPGGDVSELGLEANMKSATATVSYPVMYQRDLALLPGHLLVGQMKFSKPMRVE